MASFIRELRVQKQSYEWGSKDFVRGISGTAYLRMRKHETAGARFRKLNRWHCHQLGVIPDLLEYSLASCAGTLK